MPTMTCGVSCAAVLGLMLVGVPSPRRISTRGPTREPEINSTAAVTGFAFSTGSVLTDPTLPVQDVKANIGTPSVGVARVFNLFGKTARPSPRSRIRGRR